MRRSTGIWRGSIAQDEVVSTTGVHPVEARMARTIKKLAHYREEASALRTIEPRMDQGLDGCDTRQDVDAEARRHRDGPAGSDGLKRID
jgi:hypothetical protein